MTLVDTPFVIGDCRVEPRLNRIIEQGEATEVEPKVMRVLLCLASTPGEVRSRGELLDAVWPDTVVTDHVLTRAISHLRQALGDSVQRPRYIQTISKSGYRLIADVTVPEAAPMAPGRRAPGVGGLVLVLMAGLAWWQAGRPAPQAEVYAAVPVVSTPGLDYRPMLSPDGTFLVFMRPGENGTSDLFVKQVGAEQEVRLTSHPGYDDSATWLPGGHEVAFQRMHEGTCALYAVAVVGGAERRLGPCTALQRGLDASPDGRWFVVTDRERVDAPRSLYLVDARTFERRRLTTPPENEMDYDPVFSPDGASVAFTRGLRHPGVVLTDIYVVALGEGAHAPRRLTTDRAHVAGLAWTPDGQHLVFSSNRRGPYSLWKVPLTGGTPAYLAGVQTHDPGALSLARHTGRLAFEEWHFDFNVWAFDPRTDSLRTVASSTRWDQQPDVSADGARVAFLSDRRGEPEIWTTQRDGSGARPVVAEKAVSAPRWSPDGRWIAYNAAENGQMGVFVVNAEGGTPRRLDTDADGFNPSWSQDGEWIYYSTHTEGRWQAWKRPARGGEPARLVVEDGYVVREAPDHAVYYSRHLAPGLWRLGPDGRSEKVLGDLWPGDGNNWDVTGEAVYYIARAEGQALLTRYDLGSGTAHALHAFHPGRLVSISGLSVAPDGEVFVSLVDEHESDIHLVDSLVV